VTLSEASHVARLANAPWRIVIADETLQAFHRALRHVDIDSALRAVDACLQEQGRKWSVTPPELLAVIEREAKTTANEPPRIDPHVSMLESYTINGRRYVRASAYGRRAMGELNARERARGMEARAKRTAKRSAALSDNARTVSKVISEVLKDVDPRFPNGPRSPSS
jgi:predicted metal-dependent hydrolase